MSSWRCGLSAESRFGIVMLVRGHHDPSMRGCCMSNWLAAPGCALPVFYAGLACGPAGGAAGTGGDGG